MLFCHGECTKSTCKVRDQCNRTGNYKGAAHVRCNINHTNNRQLPVVFHNLRDYDSHIVLNLAFEICGTAKSITAIPTSMEKCMTSGMEYVKLIDAFQCMASSLETLADNLITKSTDKFEMFENVNKQLNADVFTLVCQK